jgi:vanillate O-demethylase ferredoxin subunit
MNATATSNLTVRVARKQREALGIDSFELVAADGAALPAFAAGSHIDVHVPGGLVRQYSLCNHPSETQRYQIAVLRDANSRGGSRAMHDSVQEGDSLQISPPRNHFALEQGAQRHLLLAGGIGVTPLLCMAEALLSDAGNFELHYATRSPERTAFADRIASCGLANHTHFHFDDGAPAQKLDLSAVLSQAQAGVHVYVCGPKGFMDAALNAARGLGWPEAQLHSEYFSADATIAADSESFEVQVASTGRVIVVPKDKTIVQALAAEGIELQTSCEQGVCGTCLTPVLSGIPDHKDLYLTPEEHAKNDQMLPCCSRAKSARLVLDI